VNCRVRTIYVLVASQVSLMAHAIALKHRYGAVARVVANGITSIGRQASRLEAAFASWLRWNLEQSGRYLPPPVSRRPSAKDGEVIARMLAARWVLKGCLAESELTIALPSVEATNGRAP